MDYEEHSWSFEELGSKLEIELPATEPAKYQGLSKQEAARYVGVDEEFHSSSIQPSVVDIKGLWLPWVYFIASFCAVFTAGGNETAPTLSLPPRLSLGIAGFSSSSWTPLCSCWR